MLNTASISDIEIEIYKALDEGKDSNLPCAYGQLDLYFNMLKNANLYLCTTNLLREIIKRDCVHAFQSVLKIFGQKDIPGSNYYRIRFFTALLQQLIIWKSVHIKKYVHGIFDQAKNNQHLPTERHILPTRLDLVSNHKFSRDWGGIHYSYIPKNLLRGYEPYVPHCDSNISFRDPDQDLSTNLSKKLFVVHCPFQAHRYHTGKLFNCGILEQTRWYDFTNVVDFIDLSTPAFLYYSSFTN